MKKLKDHKNNENLGNVFLSGTNQNKSQNQNVNNAEFNKIIELVGEIFKNLVRNTHVRDVIMIKELCELPLKDTKDLDHQIRKLYLDICPQILHNLPLSSLTEHS